MSASACGDLRRLVLVADDDPAVRWLFTSVLGDVGATVETAADGRAALERARAHRPDVVVSDILMPGMDGWELCRALRRDFTLRDVPIVLISWKEDFFQRMKELSADANEYLLKEAQRIDPAIHLRPCRRVPPTDHSAVVCLDAVSETSGTGAT